MRFHPSLAVLLFTFASACSLSAQQQSPEQVLKEKGLERLGSIYVLEGDRNALKAAQSIRSMQQTLTSEERKRQELRGRIRNGLATMSGWEADYRDALARLKRANRNDAISYNEIVADIKIAESKMSEGANLLVDWYVALVRTPDSRGKYLTQVLDVSAALEATARQYEALAADDAVTTALAKLNETRKPPAKLGPAPGFDQNLRFVRRLRETISSDTIPVRYEANSPHVEISFNGQTPFWIVLDSGASLIQLTDAVARKVGVAVPADAPMINITIANGQTIKAKLASIRSVRMGAVEANDVDCVVLPPEMNNADCLLGNTFLRNFVYRLDPNARELHITQFEARKAPDSGSPRPSSAPRSQAAPAAPAAAQDTAAAVPPHPLTEKLNEPKHWKADKGTWTLTADNHFRGEGDSNQRFLAPLPESFTFSFSMKVTKGMRPRVYFRNAGLHFGNEGYSKTLTMHGDKEGRSEPVPYVLDQELAVSITFAGDGYECAIDGKKVASGKRKGKDLIELQLSGGDHWSAGATEFWNLKITTP